MVNTSFLYEYPWSDPSLGGGVAGCEIAPLLKTLATKPEDLVQVQGLTW